MAFPLGSGLAATIWNELHIFTPYRSLRWKYFLGSSRGISAIAHMLRVFNPDIADEELLLFKCQPGLSWESFTGSSASGLILFLVTNRSFNSFGILYTERRKAGSLSACLSACLSEETTCPPSLHTEPVLLPCWCSSDVCEGKEGYSLSILPLWKWITAEDRQLFRHRTSIHEISHRSAPTGVFLSAPCEATSHSGFVPAFFFSPAVGSGGEPIQGRLPASVGVEVQPPGPLLAWKAQGKVRQGWIAAPASSIHSHPQTSNNIRRFLPLSG